MGSGSVRIAQSANKFAASLDRVRSCARRKGGAIRNFPDRHGREHFAVLRVEHGHHLAIAGAEEPVIAVEGDSAGPSPSASGQRATTLWVAVSIATSLPSVEYPAQTHLAPFRRSGARNLTEPQFFPGDLLSRRRG